MPENVPSSESFSFEEWAKLWAEDPAAAEARRIAETKALIDSAPSHLRQRLEAIQWRVDQERTLHDNPMGNAAALNGMMIEMHCKKGGLYDQIIGPMQEISKALKEMFQPKIGVETPRARPILSIVSERKE